MEIRPGSQGAPIPSSETTSYSTQRSSYPHNPSEFINNAGPVGPRGSPQTLPSISSSKSSLPDHSYYSGVPKLTQPSTPLPMEQSGPPRYTFEKPAIDLESYRGNPAYNQATFPDSVNGLKDTRDGYSSREYNNYPKYPPVQREYLPYERERERDTSYEYTRHGKNEPTYPRHPNSGISESVHHWNPADSTWSHDSFPPRYPPSSRSYNDHRNYPAGGATDRGVSIHKREEYLESSLQRNPSISDHERKVEVKTEEPLSEHRVKSSSPLALDKVVENCRRLSHFAFEYGNRSDRVYPYPSDSLVKEMAAKAQDILHVLTSLGSESIKSGNRNEQALGDEDMEYIRNKRTLLAPSRPKYRKRSKRSGQPPPGRCHSCNTTETPEWRRGPDGARTLCNACGLHFAKLTRKRALVAAAATANDTADSENGDKEPSRRSDGDSRKDNESVKSSDA